VILDGEVVAMDDQGRPSFQALHHQSAHRLVFVAAEVLHLDGRDLTAISLSCKLV
jgi:ATP-dependent DNA ligase